VTLDLHTQGFLDALGRIDARKKKKMTYQILKGNSLDLLPTLADNSIDAIVTDPPYGLGNPDPDYIIKAIQLWASGDRAHIPEGKGFMGKSWDSFVPPPAIWDECLRVLKPGGHLLAFAGTRTYDLMGISIRMAGFEIRDSIGWVYGSGFPKSLDVSKAIDKAAGAEREVMPQGSTKCHDYPNQCSGHAETGKFSATVHALPTAPSTHLAKQWQGWGTALKPALEPIVVARKPLIGTVAENVLTHGTGGLNIDASRIEAQDQDLLDAAVKRMSGNLVKGQLNFSGNETIKPNSAQGRWPANLILDEYTAELLDEQSGNRPSAGTYQNPDEPMQLGTRNGNNDPSKFLNEVYLNSKRYNTYAGEQGGASRFFYVAKASKRDRNEGLEDLPEKGKVFNGKNPESAGMADGSVEDKFTTQPAKNFHPTVKPTELMRYLVKLITPPGGTVLDPFTGSGSTGKAAILEGFDFIGIELTEDYWPIIEGRLKHAEAKVAERIKETSDQEQEKLF
jgi:site-specific DNA-methyltransferase (adenine-specific)